MINAIPFALSIISVVLSASAFISARRYKAICNLQIDLEKVSSGILHARALLAEDRLEMIDLVLDDEEKSQLEEKIKVREEMGRAETTNVPQRRE